jgi:hypothetical protein
MGAAQTIAVQSARAAKVFDDFMMHPPDWFAHFIDSFKRAPMAVNHTSRQPAVTGNGSFDRQQTRHD